jgi:hypothetical protein
MLSATSLDSIIEGLKQGNALELEFIKKLREGLDFIADNMQKECYNRSDAFSEAHQMLAKVSSSSLYTKGPLVNVFQERSTGHGHITADQKAVLASVIKINILRNEKTIGDSKTAFEVATEKLSSGRVTNRKEHERALNRALEEKKRLNSLADTINALRSGVAANQLRAVMSIWEERQDLLQKEGLRIEGIGTRSSIWSLRNTRREKWHIESRFGSSTPSRQLRGSTGMRSNDMVGSAEMS